MLANSTYTKVTFYPTDEFREVNGAVYSPLPRIETDLFVIKTRALIHANNVISVHFIV